MSCPFRTLFFEAKNSLILLRIYYTYTTATIALATANHLRCFGNIRQKDLKVSPSRLKTLIIQATTTVGGIGLYMIFQNTNETFLMILEM